MTLSYSNIVSISYFAVYTLFLFVLGYIVYKQGGHESVKSKSYMKDLWAQRKIYAPLLVYFYDTASDIGVLIFWYQLMMDEQNGLRDYNSVDMTLYFWLGVSFMLLYRIVMVLWTLAAYIQSEDDYDYDWYDPILVVFDVYIFKSVYISFNKARETLSNNAKKSKKQKNQKETQVKMEIEMASVNTETTPDVYDDDVQELQPSVEQIIAQLLESVLEAMPQIILQSIFVLRSANDDDLQAASSNDMLVTVSIIASLISISNKYIATVDVDFVVDKAIYLKPRLQCPGCIQYWYIIRLLWRIFDIMSRFVIYVLIWAVIGGAWLPIWFGLVYIVGVITWYFVDKEGLMASVLYGIITAAGIELGKGVTAHICKYVENLIGLTIITTFTLIEFDCWKCSDAKARQMTNNNRILIFVIMGWSSLFGEIILYVIMRTNAIIED
eukprot:334230_1